MQRLSLDGVALGALKTHFVWSGANIQISSFQLALPEGRARGKGSVSLTNARPRYNLSGEVVNFPWKGGLLDISGELTTAGSGPDTLLNLRALGDFTGKDIVASQEASFSSLSGNYVLSFDSGWPRLQLAKVHAEQPEEAWEGTGSTGKDGSLTLELIDGARQMHVVSTLDPLPPSAAPVANSANSSAP